MTGLVHAKAGPDGRTAREPRPALCGDEDAKKFAGPMYGLPTCDKCLELQAEAATMTTYDHQVGWTARRSFVWEITCTCGWRTSQMMEKDAVEDARKHLTENGWVAL